MSAPADAAHRAAQIEIVPITSDDRAFVRAELTRHFASERIFSGDREYQADQLAGRIAWLNAERVGHITWAPVGATLEVVTLSTTIDGSGVGTLLLDAGVAEARRLGHRRIFLNTSNDNLRALAFYQKRGWRLVAVHRGSVDAHRERQKAIPNIGLNGIPLHDEIELELRL